MFKKLGLKGQVLLPVCAFITVILIVLVSIILVRQNQIAKQQATELANALTQKYGNSIKAEIEVAMDAARTLAHTFQSMKKQNTIKKLNRTELINIIKDVLSENKDFFGMSSAWEPNALDGKDSEFAGTEYHDNTGRFIPYMSFSSNGINVEPLVGYETEGDGDYYLLPKRTGKEQLIEPYEYEVSGEKVFMTTVSAPILSENQSFLGIITVDLAFDRIQKLIESITPFETGYAYLVSNKGVLAAHSSKDKIGKNILDLIRSEKKFEVSEAVNAGKPYQFYETNAEGVKFIQILSPFTIGKTTTPWQLGIAVPVDKVMEESINMAYISAILGLFAIIALSAVVFIITKRLVDRIVAGVAFAKQVSRGNLNDTIAIKRDDEFGQLGRTLNDMVHTLKLKEELAQKISNNDLTANIELASEEDELGKSLMRMKHNLSGMLQQIKENSSTMSNSLVGLSTTSNQMSNATSVMSSQSHTVAGAAEEISTSIATMASSNSEMNANVQSIAATSTQMSQNMGDISNSMEGLANAIQQVSEKSENARHIAQNAIEQSTRSSRTMNDLDQSAFKIGEFSQIIKEIAQQTNLLALNANIEAASAGEAGKGFAVVANEIKELANQSSRSAEDISSTITEIQQNTESSVKSMGEVAEIIASIDKSTTEISTLSKSGEESVNQIVNNVKEAAIGVQDVSKLIGEISTVTETSARMSEEFTRSIGEISNNMQELNTGVNETAEGINQVHSETTALSKISEDLQQVVELFKLDKNTNL